MRLNFRPLEQKDLPLMHVWVNTDFVIRWFGKTPMTFDDVKTKYSPYITGEKPTRAYIIMMDDTDIGYIQTYLVIDYPEYNDYVRADAHTAGVDLFIGHKDYIHKGHGAQIMKAFLKDYVFTIPQADQCIIGPEPKNRAAIRMYEKAGFRWYKTIQVPDADEPEYLMKLSRTESGNL